MSISFLRTFLLYVTIVVALRLMGKRQIGELEPSELVVTILVSELAAIPMQDVTVPLFAGMVPDCNTYFHRDPDFLPVPEKPPPAPPV